MSKLRSKLKSMIVLLVSMLMIGNSYGMIDGAYYAIPDSAGDEHEFYKEIKINDNHTIEVQGKYKTNLFTSAPPNPQPLLAVKTEIDIYKITEVIKYADENGTPVIETNIFKTHENSTSSSVSNGVKNITNKIAGLQLYWGTSMTKEATIIQEPKRAAKFYFTFPDPPNTYNGAYQELDASSVSSRSAFRGFYVGVEIYPHSIYIEGPIFPKPTLLENEPSAVTTGALYITVINSNGELETKHIFSPYIITVSWHYKYLWLV